MISKVDVLTGLLLFSLTPTFFAGFSMQGRINATLEFHDRSTPLRFQEPKQLGLTFENVSKISNLTFRTLKPVPTPSETNHIITDNGPGDRANGAMEKNVPSVKTSKVEGLQASPWLWTSSSNDKYQPEPRRNFSKNVSLIKGKNVSCPHKFPAKKKSRIRPPSWVSQNSSSADRWPYWMSQKSPDGLKSHMDFMNLSSADRWPSWDSLAQDAKSLPLRRRGRAQQSQLIFRKVKRNVCTLRIALDGYFIKHVSNREPYKSDLYRTITNLAQFVDFQILQLGINKGRLLDMGLQLAPIVIYEKIINPGRSGESRWDPAAFFSELSVYDFKGFCAGLLFTYQQLDPAHTPAGGVSMINVQPDPKAGACKDDKPPNVDKPLNDYSAYYRNALPVNFRKGTDGVASSYVVMAQMVHNLAVILGAPTDRPGTECFSSEANNYATAFPIPQTLRMVNQEISPCARRSIEAAEPKNSKCLQECLMHCTTPLQPGTYQGTTTSTTTTSTTTTTTTTSTTTTTTKPPPPPPPHPPTHRNLPPPHPPPRHTLPPPSTYGPYNTRFRPVPTMFFLHGWTETCVTTWLEESPSRAARHHRDSVAHAMLLLWLVAASVAAGWLLA